MHEQKYKIWDAEKGQMKVQAYLTTIIKGYGFAAHIKKDFSFQWLTFLEYTGRKDMDGNEIYRGDCFSIDSEKTGTRIGIATVVWSDTDNGWRLSDNIRNGELYLNWYAKNKKVVGNIYQNPELLK